MNNVIGSVSSEAPLSSQRGKGKKSEAFEEASTPPSKQGCRGEGVEQGSRWERGGVLVPELPTPSFALLSDERENPAIFLLGEGGSGEEKRESQESSIA